MIQAKDIPDAEVLVAIRATSRGAIGWSCTWDIQSELDKYPAKVVMAKLRSLKRKKKIDGCDCGCRGDWEIV